MNNEYYFAPLPKRCIDHRFPVKDNVMLKKLVRSYVMKKNREILQNDKISILNKMKIIEKMNKKLKPLTLFNNIQNEISEYTYYY